MARSRQGAGHCGRLNLVAPQSTIMVNSEPATARPSDRGRAVRQPNGPQWKQRLRAGSRLRGGATSGIQSTAADGGPVTRETSREGMDEIPNALPPPHLGFRSSPPPWWRSDWPCRAWLGESSPCGGGDERAGALQKGHCPLFSHINIDFFILPKPKPSLPLRNRLKLRGLYTCSPMFLNEASKPGANHPRGMTGGKLSRTLPRNFAKAMRSNRQRRIEDLWKRRK